MARKRRKNRGEYNAPNCGKVCVYVQPLGQAMDPIYEYRWSFVETCHWGGKKETNFHMTDEEAKVWWAYGQPGTARIESTKRDRNAKIDASASFTGSMKPWDHGGVPY